MSLNMLLEKQRLAAVEGPVREQFGEDLQGPHRRRAGLEGAQVGEAVTALSIASSPRSNLPVPDAATTGHGLAHEVVRQEGRRRDLQGHRPQEDRRRQAAPRRPRHRGDPADRGRGRRQPARARLRPVPARPDAGALDASRSARRRKVSGSTTSRSRRIAATCTTTTSRRSRSGRRASCAARSGATSATVRSHSARSRR